MDPPDSTTRIPSVLRRLIEKSGLSQAAAAAAAGVHLTTLEKILAGKSQPRADVLARLLTAAGGRWADLDR